MLVILVDLDDLSCSLIDEKVLFFYIISNKNEETYVHMTHTVTFRIGSTTCLVLVT